jgi:hypothetical protein
VERNLDEDPGWQVDNTGPGGWEFGPPQGDGGSTGPAVAPTGTNVYGTNLAGDYGDYGEYVLTTESFDLTGLRHSDLRFQEWLDNEAGFDIAKIEISTDGGQSWTEAWSGFEYGDGWKLRRLDVSSLADREEDVRFRFRLETDASTTRSGSYIDDLQICGEEIPTVAGKLKHLAHVVNDTDPFGGNGNGTVDVGETVTLELNLGSNRDTLSTNVAAFLSTTTPGVTVRTDYAAFPDIAPGGTGWSLGPHFTFTVDGACGSEIAFTLDILWDGGQSTATFSVPVGHDVVVAVLDDDFEIDLGWMTGGDASQGFWAREDPFGVDDAQSNPVQPEDDTTPDPGAACWITDNTQPSGNFDPRDADVDDGTVWLESPAFDGTGARRLDLSFYRWFVRRVSGPAPDYSNFTTLLSTDGGVNWLELDYLDADSPFWAPVTYDLSRALPPTSDMKVRIEVEERVWFGPGDTLVEGLIDDVRVERERLECEPYSPPAAQAPNGIGETLRASRSGLHLRLNWQAPPGDGTHDEASGYRVYHSASPGQGFTMISLPTTTFAVLRDELLVPDTRYLAVVAENSGGTSGDEPF